MKKIFIIGLLTINTVLLIPAMEIEKTEINEIESNQVLLNNQLMEAVKAGKIGFVKKLLNLGATVDAKDKDESTPLHEAAKKGYGKIIRLLIANGANVNAINNGDTPLHKASLEGHKKIVKLLLDKNADMNVESYNGDTPLHDASLGGSKEIVKIFMDKKAKVNAININGNTPLLYALHSKKKNHIKTVKQIIAAPLLLKQSSVNSSIKEVALGKLKALCVINASKVFNLINISTFNCYIMESIFDNILPIEDDNDTESQCIKEFLKLCYQNKKSSVFAQLFIREFYKNHLIQLKLYIAIKNNDNSTAIYIAKDRNENNIVSYLEGIENAQNYDELNKKLKKQIKNNYCS